VHNFVHRQHVVGRHQVFVQQVLAEEEISGDRRDVFLPVLRVCTHDPNQDEHEIGQEVFGVVEVDDQLAEHPAGVGEPRVVEVEYEHVCVYDVLQERDR
jgi:hypothetical protein